MTYHYLWRNHTGVTTISGGDPTLNVPLVTRGSAPVAEISALSQVSAFDGSSCPGVSGSGDRLKSPPKPPRPGPPLVTFYPVVTDVPSYPQICGSGLVAARLDRY